MPRPSDPRSAETTASTDWVELASREGDGLEISLHWSPATGRIKVSVLDQRLQASFDVHVAGAHALRAFHHPFAYASRQGAGFGHAQRETADLQPQN